MPTVLRLHGYRFYFFSHKPNEPPHIHVDRGEATLKVWLDPIEPAKRGGGFRAHEINVILALVAEHRTLFEDKWHEYFDQHHR